MSANRFVLVPEDIYRGLSSSSLENTGNLNLDFARKSLEKAKREKSDPTTKNIHYNQELRRYLHLKKLHDEKPVKVAIEGGLPVGGAQQPPAPAAPPRQQQQQQQRRRQRRPPLPPIPRQRSSSDAFSTADDDGADTDPSNASDFPSSAGGRHSGDSTLRAETEERDPTKPSASTPIKSQKEWKDELIQILTSDPDKFNLTHDGRIKNRQGKVMTGSDIHKSLDWIYANRRGQKPIGKRPYGTYQLEEIFKNEPLLRAFLPPQIGKGGHFTLKSANKKAKTATLTKNNNNNNNNTFSPKLWKLN